MNITEDDLEDVGMIMGKTPSVLVWLDNEDMPCFSSNISDDQAILEFLEVIIHDLRHRLTVAVN